LSLIQSKPFEIIQSVQACLTPRAGLQLSGKMGKESMGKAVGQDGKGVHGEGGHGDGEGSEHSGQGILVASLQQVLLE
jgi:hypothetical protein